MSSTNRWEGLWRTFRFPLIVALGTLPLPLLITARLTPELIRTVWLRTAVFVLVDALGTKVRGKLRLLYGAAILGATGVNLWQTVKTGADLFMLTVPGIYCALLICGLCTDSQGRNEHIAEPWYSFSAAIHLVAQLSVSLFRTAGNPVPSAVSAALLVCFFVFALLGMLSMNQANVRQATFGRLPVSRRIRRRNLLLTLLLFGVSALLSMLPFLASVLGLLFRKLAGAVLWLWSAAGSLEFLETTRVGGGHRGGTPVLPEYGAEDSFVKFLPAVITGVFAAGILALLLCSLFGKLPGILRRMLEANDGKDTLEDAFRDEITPIRKELRVRERFSRREERKLPPEQRIRYRYRWLMHRHPEWDRGTTPREKLPLEAARIYEKARYSNRTVTEEEAEAFCREAENR